MAVKGRVKVGFRGPAKMRANKVVVMKDAVGVERPVVIPGYNGRVGYRLHPTKGWRKDASHHPLALL